MTFKERSDKKVVGQLLRYERKLSQRSKHWLNTKGWMNTDHLGADRLARRDPNAWLMGLIFDQMVIYEKAWQGPYLLKERLGHLNVKTLARMKPRNLERVFRGKRVGEAIHRFPRKMAKWIQSASRRLVDQFDGDASNVWRNCRTGAEVIARLREFDGISLKKAHMGARLLREFRSWQKRLGAPAFSQAEINVAVDVHVRRVWMRTRLATERSAEAILSRAAALKPDYPGQLDYPSFLIGRTWCHAHSRDCQGTHNGEGPCPLSRVCPSSQG